MTYCVVFRPLVHQYTLPSQFSCQITQVTGRLIPCMLVYSNTACNLVLDRTDGDNYSPNRPQSLAEYSYQIDIYSPCAKLALKQSWTDTSVRSSKMTIIVSRFECNEV